MPQDTVVEDYDTLPGDYSSDGRNVKGGGGGIGGLMSGGLGMLLGTAGGPAGPLLALLAPHLISWLMGAGRGEELRQRRIKELTDPAYLAKMQALNMQQIVGGAGFQSGMGQIAAGTNATMNDLGAALAARGLGTSGMGAIMNSLGGSLAGSQQAKMYTAANQQAQNAAQQQIASQLAAVQGLGGPTPGQLAVGNAMQSLSPLITAYARKKWDLPDTGTYGGGGNQPPGAKSLSGSELRAPRG